MPQPRSILSLLLRSMVSRTSVARGWLPGFPLYPSALAVHSSVLELRWIVPPPPACAGHQPVPLAFGAVGCLPVVLVSALAHPYRIAREKTPQTTSLHILVWWDNPVLPGVLLVPIFPVSYCPLPSADVDFPSGSIPHPAIAPDFCYQYLQGTSAGDLIWLTYRRSSLSGYHLHAGANTCFVFEQNV